MRVTPAATLGALTGASGLGVTRANDQTHRAPRTMEGKPMADNPKSLASLADELERKADALGIISRCEEYRLDADLYRRAAAALRAPTIAAGDARQVTPEEASRVAKLLCRALRAGEGSAGRWERWGNCLPPPSKPSLRQKGKTP